MTRESTDADVACRVQTSPLTVTLVTVTQFRAIWLQWHFSYFPNGLSYSKICLESNLDTVTQYGAFWLQWLILFPLSRGCDCKRGNRYHNWYGNQNSPKMIMMSDSQGTATSLAPRCTPCSPTTSTCTASPPTFSKVTWSRMASKLREKQPF